MNQPKATTELSFTILEYYDNYVISKVKEDHVVGKKEILELIDVTQKYFKEKSYVYISQRDNLYNVDPSGFFQFKNIRMLLGIAIVSKRLGSLNMANFERKFSPVPFEIFMELNEAITWTEKLLKKE